MQKKGISLIVLVITIIVMIILAATVVISLTNTGIIDRASEAVDITDKQQIEHLAALAWAEAYTEGIRDLFILDTKVSDALEKNGVDVNKYNTIISNGGIQIEEKELELNEFGFYNDVKYMTNNFTSGDGNIVEMDITFDGQGVYARTKIINRTWPEGCDTSSHDIFKYIWVEMKPLIYNKVYTGVATFDAQAKTYIDNNGVCYTEFYYPNVAYSERKVDIGNGALVVEFAEDGMSFELLEQKIEM